MNTNSVPNENNWSTRYALALKDCHAAETRRIGLIAELDAKVSDLPNYLQLENLDEVRNALEQHKQSGAIVFDLAGHPTRPSRQGKRIAEEKINAIVAELRAGTPGNIIARRFGVSQSTVSGIKNSIAG